MEKLYPSVSNVNMVAAHNLLDMELDLLSMLNQHVDVHANKDHPVLPEHLVMTVTMAVMGKMDKTLPMEEMVMF